MNTQMILRQSDSEILSVKVTRCGENSRLMANVLRYLGTTVALFGCLIRKLVDGI